MAGEERIKRTKSKLTEDCVVLPNKTEKISIGLKKEQQKLWTSVVATQVITLDIYKPYVVTQFHI
jgi:hypothetical protein